MFSRNSKEPEVVAPAPQSSTKRVTRSNVPSIISSDLTVRGTLISTGDVQVDGRVEGDIRAGALVIGEKAVIEGDIYAEDAIIRGRVEGAIRARKVQLCATSHVQGNILHEALAMEAGAFFEGNCRHSDNPLSDSIDERRPSAPPILAKPSPSLRPAEDMHRPAPSAPAPKPATATFTPLKA